MEITAVVYKCVFLCQQCEVIPSELSVMRVTFWPFCMLLDWPPLDTESLASDPLSCSSWLSSGPGTFTRIVFCRLLATVLYDRETHICGAVMDNLGSVYYSNAWPENRGIELSMLYRIIDSLKTLTLFRMCSVRMGSHISWYTVWIILTHLLSRFSSGVSSWLFGGSLLTITFVCGTTLQEELKTYWWTEQWEAQSCFHMCFGQSKVGFQ